MAAYVLLACYWGVTKALVNRPLWQNGARHPAFGGMTRSSLQRFTTQKTRLNSTLTSKHVISGK